MRIVCHYVPYACFPVFICFPSGKRKATTEYVINYKFRYIAHIITFSFSLVTGSVRRVTMSVTGNIQTEDFGCEEALLP